MKRVGGVRNVNSHTKQSRINVICIKNMCFWLKTHWRACVLPGLIMFLLKFINDEILIRFQCKSIKIIKKLCFTKFK